jgi:hypothetical protein
VLFCSDSRCWELDFWRSFLIECTTNLIIEAIEKSPVMHFCSYLSCKMDNIAASFPTPCKRMPMVT